MLSFYIVKKIGEGSYLDESQFIIERARKEKTLRQQRVYAEISKSKARSFSRNAKPGLS